VVTLRVLGGFTLYHDGEKGLRHVDSRYGLDLKAQVCDKRADTRTTKAVTTDETTMTNNAPAAMKVLVADWEGGEVDMVRC